MSPQSLSFSAAISGRVQGPEQSRPSLGAAPSPRGPVSASLLTPSRRGREAAKWRVSAQFPQWGLPQLGQRTPTTVSASASASSAADPPTVSDTKAAFLQAYPLPIPSIYNTVIQELLVQQHLTRYTRSYKYDPVFALGFVTVYDQLLDGYPSPDQRDPIFQAYIQALKEDPAQYRADAERLEKWASSLPSASALVEFASGDGDVEEELKTIAARVKAGKGEFHYSRFFAVGLFRLLELAKASDPQVLQQLCEALGVNKMSVNRDLDVYRGLLSKLTQAKELLRDFLKREKEKKSQKQAAVQEKATAE